MAPRGTSLAPLLRSATELGDTLVSIKQNMIFLSAILIILVNLINSLSTASDFESFGIFSREFQLENLVNYHSSYSFYSSGGSGISQTPPSPKGIISVLSCKHFAKNCMKTKEFGPNLGERGACP